MSDLFFVQLSLFDLLDPYLKTVEKVLITERELSDLKALAKKGLVNLEKVEEYMNKGKIEVTPPPRKENLVKATKEGLSGGEMEAVATYDQVKARFIVSEDDFMRAHQEKFNVRPISFADSIWYMAGKGVITREKAINVLDQLKNMGWYQADVIDFIKKNLNGLLKPLSGKQLEKFIKASEEYENLKKSLSAAAEDVGITTFEFVYHYIRSGRSLKYGINDFRKAQKWILKFLGPDYPPK